MQGPHRSPESGGPGASLCGWEESRNARDRPLMHMSEILEVEWEVSQQANRTPAVLLTMLPG